MSTSSNQTPRILTRGEQTSFRVSFYEDANNTTPMEPLSPDFPAYTVYDPSGVAIQAGVGTMIQPGQFKADFLVPKDAPLSYFGQKPQQYDDKNQGAPLTADGSRYRIEWQIVTNSNYQVNFVEEFDVRDLAVTQSESRELKHLVRSGKAFPVTYRTTTIPYRATLELIIRGQEDSPVVDIDFEAANPSATDLKIVQDGDSYVLHYQVADGVTKGNTVYMALWEIQETALSVPETSFSIITAINTNLFPLMTSLRMLIDKFQKRLGRLQSYEDSDLLEYIAHGTRMVNLSHPFTNYTIDSMPDTFQPLILLAAGWYGLKAQSILEADLSFNFSGQSVTLSVDRAGQLDSAASAMMEMFNQQIGPAKMSVVRQARGVGTVAGRAYSYRQLYQHVYRISTVGSDNLLTTLTKIGLL